MLHEVGDAHYIVELTHNPADGSAVCWTARVYEHDTAGSPIFTTFGSSRENAFDAAQEWVKASQETPEPTSLVHLDRSGEIVTTFEGQS